MPVKKVRRDVALNPVARAVALHVLRGSVRDGLIVLFGANDGDNVRKTILDMSEYVAIVMRAMEMAGQEDDPDYRVMKGALSTMVDVSRAGFVWHTRHARAIDAGVTRAVEITAKRLHPRQIQAAWLALRVAGAIAGD